MGGDFYWPGDRGLHYAYATEATYECPIGKLTSFWIGDQEPPEALVRAAEILGLPAKTLGGLLRGSYGCGQRRRVDDRLTDQCERHHCKMSKRGYRAYIDRPQTDREMADNPHSGSTLAINRRLTGDRNWRPRVVVEQRYCDTKKEAKAWAYRKAEEAAHA